MARPRKLPRLIKIPGKERWYIKDGRHQESTFTSDSLEAEQCLVDYINDKNSPRADATLTDLLSKRMENAQFKKLARLEAIECFHVQLNKHLGYLRSDQLTSVYLQDYSEKRSHVPGALREELIELKTTLNYALKKDWIGSIPEITLPAKRPPRERFISKEDANKLLKAAYSMHLRVFILIAMSTAARKGAILGLTWDRVDLERNRIDFRDPELAETKKRRSIVPINSQVAAVLKDLKRYAQTPFVVEYMGQPVSDIKKSFHRACIKAELEGVSPHILKHSVISWLAMDRFSVDQISDMTATSRETIIRVYRKFSPDYLAPLAESLVPAEGFANLFAKQPN